ncbi:Iron-regulated protein FrpA [Trichinella spiralis]|uniref:Iron-regulated protein FrpA n=1 Tax=Trichinella spiralis TaxID=6334 RepID=A0A0V1BU82_TRISP|nr:Iron-regulated protein FrpA [Trichinella spiralis]
MEKMHSIYITQDVDIFKLFTFMCNFQIMLLCLLYVFKRTSANSLFLFKNEKHLKGHLILLYCPLVTFCLKTVTPFCVTVYSSVPCVPLGVGLDPVYGYVGLDPLDGYVGLDPLDGDVGLDPLDGYVGLDPLDGDVGLDPLDGYVGLDPLDGDVGLDPVYGLVGLDVVDKSTGESSFEAHFTVPSGEFSSSFAALFNHVTYDGTLAYTPG